jgi:hypothetical protein
MERFETFIGYPSDNNISGVIENAVDRVKQHDSASSIGSWKALDTAGAFIDEEVTESIEQCKYFVADLTKLNFNVVYEVGYAIANKKPVLLTLNSSLRNEIDNIAQLGIFDTIGYEKYTNSQEFQALIGARATVKPIKVLTKKDIRMPVYQLLGRNNIDQQIRIVSRTKLAKLATRLFDPNEQSRMSSHDAIDNVAASYGVLVHLLPDTYSDFYFHNLRAAFVCGLAHGFGIKTLIIQIDNGPIPLDYRDFVTQCLNLNQIDDAIAEFGKDIFEAIQQGNENRIETTLTLLEGLNLGASSAENELRDLGQYYLKTDPFMRAERGEARLIVGRKGSGKTAIFYQLRDRIRRDKSNMVVDLKPEGYQLLKFKDQVLNILNTGSQIHTITAFWEYLLLLEICQSLIEKDKLHHLRDHDLYEPYKRLSALYVNDEYIVEGDFSERMSRILEHIRNDFQAKYSDKDHEKVDLSQAEITNLIYRHDVNKLRDEVLDYIESKNSLWLLFDNLDKGWPAHGLKTEDLIIIRSLIEATRKIERDLHKRHIEAHTLIFLRNDVYELLVDETSDRGKEAIANVDWNDPDALKELIRKRVLFNGIGNSAAKFEELWPALCVSHVNGEESFSYLLDRSLMRPRFLIDLINFCKGNAVTLGHEKIDESDLLKGVNLFSDSILNDIGYELRDVYPIAENVLYAFIGTSAELSLDHIKSQLTQIGIDEKQHQQIIELMLWYSFLGFIDGNNEHCYLYNCNYNFKKFQGLIQTAKVPVRYVINKAFWPALGISSK